MAGNGTDGKKAGMYGHYHYNPVNVSEGLGVILMGTFALALLVALLRAQARNRELLAQLAKRAGDEGRGE